LIDNTVSVVNLGLFVYLLTTISLVVYGTNAKALTGASDAIKYKRKYKFQIANLLLIITLLLFKTVWISCGVVGHIPI